MLVAGRRWFSVDGRPVRPVVPKRNQPRSDRCRYRSLPGPTRRMPDDERDPRDLLAKPRDVRSMVRRSIPILLAALLAPISLLPSEALAQISRVLCQRKSGAVFVRVGFCAKKETQIDVRSLGLGGPSGPSGPAGAAARPA